MNMPGTYQGYNAGLFSTKKVLILVHRTYISSLGEDILEEISTI
jgi:hypothetical protein